MNVKDIEKGSIQIVKRDGSRVELQCLQKDVVNLPTSGVLSGSSCLVLDAGEQDSVLYVYNQTETKKAGTWYPL